MSELVTVEQVAVRAGLPLPVSNEHRAAIELAIEDAYGQVAAHFQGRSPVPARYTEHGVAAGTRGTWRLRQEPVISVESVTAERDPVTDELTGLHTITYLAGLDPQADEVYGRVLRRFVGWAAANNPIVRRLAQQVPGARITTSESVEGQSQTYETGGGGAPGSGQAGEVPTLAELDAYVPVTVHQREGVAPHPMESGRPWWS